MASSRHAPRNFPARRITNFCQVFAIFNAEAMTIATTSKAAPGTK
jgi:hypothetical protein